MHELSIALSILDLVEEEAERQGGRVAAVHLKLGPLSGVVKRGACCRPTSWPARARRWPETELVVEEVPVVAYCPACAAERTPASVQELCCPDCGTPTPRGRPRPGAGGRRPGDRVMSEHPRLVEVRQHVLKQNDVAARALRARFHEAGDLRRQPGVQPRVGQDGVPGEGARAAPRPLPRRRPRRRPGDRQRRPPAGPQRGPGQADHHRDGLPPGGGDGRDRPGGLGPRTGSTSCSSRTSATWSAPPPSTWARTCGWSSSP